MKPSGYWKDVENVKSDINAFKPACGMPGLICPGRISSSQLRAGFRARRRTNRIPHHPASRVESGARVQATVAMTVEVDSDDAMSV